MRPTSFDSSSKVMEESVFIICQLARFSEKNGPESSKTGFSGPFFSAKSTQNLKLKAVFRSNWRVLLNCIGLCSRYESKWCFLLSSIFPYFHLSEFPELNVGRKLISIQFDRTRQTDLKYVFNFRFWVDLAEKNGPEKPVFELSGPFFSLNRAS